MSSRAGDHSPDLQRSIAELPDAVTLPPEVYTDPGWYDIERSTIFSREWLCLGRASLVADPGDYLTVEIAGETLLMVRGKDGVIRVMSAVCQHRAMLVAEGAGRASTFRCPYHHWTYALDGRLLGAPAMERTRDFDKACHGLPQLAVEEWQGFVFANLDPDATPLAPALRKLDPYLEHFHLAGAVGRPDTDRYRALPWNWKVMLENFNDGYHASRLHGGVHDFCPSDRAEFLEWDDEDGAIIRTNGFLHRDGGFNATQRALLPIFPDLTDTERSRVTFALVPPTLTLGLSPDQVFYFLVRPLDAGHIDVEIGYLFDPDAVHQPLFEERFALSRVGVGSIVAQDVATTTAVQKGLGSRFARRGRYSWQEEAQRQFNRWLVRRYRTEGAGL